MRIVLFVLATAAVALALCSMVAGGVATTDPPWVGPEAAEEWWRTTMWVLAAAGTIVAATAKPMWLLRILKLFQQ
jgi:hypothetical protein